MSDGPNESQRLISETLDGTIVVDAGPGTGKTETIVTRYVNLIARKDVEPRDVLLLTFTNNAANEMEERIKERLSDLETLRETYAEEVVERLRERSKHVQVKTFDAFCLSVIMDSPEDAGGLFGIEERLTRGATIVTNESLNREHFRSYLDRFLNDRLGDYGDWAAIASQYPVGLYNLINRLMSRGVYPMAKGWFGMDVWGQLLGDTEALLETMERRNVTGKRGGASSMATAIAKLDVNDVCSPPPIVDKTVPGEFLKEAAEDEGRREMLRLVHDVYHGYVRKCVAEDRLTFGINAMLAFSLLYGDSGVRERNSYRFVMIDEFQDTNAGQLMIALMILREPNLCVVGDWKQGIYGFRFVSIDNIIDFDARAAALREFLNLDQTRVRVRLPEKAVEVRLEYNYRSSGAIIDKAFECMELEGKDKDVIDPVLISRVSLIQPGRTDIPDEHTDIRYVQCDSVESEAEEVVRCVRDYVDSGRYVVHSRDSQRPMGYGDIAVLCRKTSHCRNVLEALRDAGIPAFLQGDMEIMSTREGKLALAWLRYISNDDDAWGYMPILADMGYSLSECLSMRGKSYMLPTEMQMMRKDLRQKTRRVTQLLSEIYGFYGLNNEITQAIITTLSTAHRDSLITIADLIRIIEDGIRERTVYPVENSIDSNAVTIMTMHKSKGLQFEAVIVPYMDRNTMPAVGGSRGECFSYDERLGVRCSKEVGRFGDYSKICTNWRTILARATLDSDYDEERRLMFVVMSRARQYETLICGPRPSKFMTGLSGGNYSDIPECPPVPHDEDSDRAKRPDVTGYTPRRKKIGVHSLMSFGDEDGMGGMSEIDEFGSGGKDHGTDVHNAAQAVFERWPVREEYPELEMIRRIVAETEKADLRYCEMDCTLPVPEHGAVLSGRIDLIAVYPDRVEIHDYKTDASDRFEAEYEFQLSVYAETASRYYGRRAVCMIDYVTMGYSKTFEPLGMDVISERVRTYLERERENMGNSEAE